MNKNSSDNVSGKFYNEKAKGAYFEDSSSTSGTKYSDRSCFLKIAKQEQFLGKDLYEFDEKDVIDFFTSGFTDSFPAARNYHSVFKQYVKWSIDKGLKKTNINPFDKLKYTRDILPIMKKLVLERKFFSEEEIWQMASRAKNAQDIVCMIPVFYGIKGVKYSQLTNLKKEDIDIVNNTVTLNTKASIRKTHLPQEIIEIFKNASEQKIYNRRGRPGYGNKITASLIDNEYVIKKSIGKKNDHISGQRLAQRCKDLLEEEGYTEMCIDDIYVSGKLSLLKHKQQQKGKIEVEDYKDVQRTFGDNDNNYNNIKDLYELAILSPKFNMFSEKTYWNDIEFSDDKDIFKYEDGFWDKDEDDMNNSHGNNDEDDMNNSDENNDEDDKGKDTSKEGGLKETHIQRYARSREARNRCIEIYEAKCYICKFDFEKVYGEFGKGLIHVHHINPISKTDGVYEIDARKDLRPVCPNCHFIIHKDKNEACSIEKVKNMIKDNESVPNDVIVKIEEQPKLIEVIRNYNDKK